MLANRCAIYYRRFRVALNGCGKYEYIIIVVRII